MSRRKVVVSVYLDQAELDGLKALSARTRVPMAVYVRRGVAAVLAQHGRAEAEPRPEEPWSDPLPLDLGPLSDTPPSERQ